MPTETCPLLEVDSVDYTTTSCWPCVLPGATALGLVLQAATKAFDFDVHQQNAACAAGLACEVLKAMALATAKMDTREKSAMPQSSLAFGARVPRSSFQGATNASSTSTIWRMVSRTSGMYVYSCIFVGGIRSETDAQSQILILTFLWSRLCRCALSDAKDVLSIVIQTITAVAMELAAKIDQTSHAFAESASVGKH